MTLNCQGKLVDLSVPKIMGILNLTPDSFYDGGQFNSIDLAVKQTEKMLQEGATFIDIGAASSRPGAELLTVEQESQRMFPILNELLKIFPNTLFSVDTYHSSIARSALDKGVALINDISGGSIDNKLHQIIANYQVPYVCMHMRGTPKTMQEEPKYHSIVEEQLSFFAEKTALLHQKGVNDIILDPGFGFGKSLEHNYEILKNLHQYHSLKCPIMVGVSRKSLIYKKLNISPERALNGTTSLHTFALQQGAHILRVHDVSEAVEVVELLQALN